MTRPPSGLSFAQFFPTAPKVRAEAHGRADGSPSEAPDTLGSSRGDALAAAQDPDTNAPSRSSRGGSSSDAHLQPHSDENNESSPGDLLSTGDSASSHISSASSIFSTIARSTPSSVSTSRPSNNNMPSYASKDSPSHSHNHATSSPKLDMLAPAAAGRSAKQPTHQSHFPHQNGFTSDASLERVPARDPHATAKGLKCTYDPQLDRHRNKRTDKSTRATYKEFAVVRTYNPACPCMGGGVISCLVEKCKRLMAKT